MIKLLNDGSAGRRSAVDSELLRYQVRELVGR